MSCHYTSMKTVDEKKRLWSSHPSMKRLWWLTAPHCSSRTLSKQSRKGTPSRLLHPSYLFLCCQRCTWQSW